MQLSVTQDDQRYSWKTVYTAVFFLILGAAGAGTVQATTLDLGPGDYTVNAQGSSPTAVSATSGTEDATLTLQGEDMTRSLPSTITVNDSGATADAVRVSMLTTGTNTVAGGNASATISNLTIVNNNVTPSSLGINIVLGPNNNAGVRRLTGDAWLTMDGTNTITVNGGGGTLVNNKGTGNATTTITGNFNLTNYTDNANNQDGVETTTQNGGTATLNMQSTGIVSVKGGNGILIDSLAADPNNGTAINRRLGGGNVVGDIGAGVTVILDNTNSGGAGVNSAMANAGIKAFTQDYVAPSGGTAGTIDLTTKATIQTLGNNADGINLAVGYDGKDGASGNGSDVGIVGSGTIKLANSGTVSTTGVASHGIEVSGYTDANPAGLVTVVNSGNITTQGGTPIIVGPGNASDGIYIHTMTIGDGTAAGIDLTNSGSITTSGDYGDGIEATSATSSTGNAGNISVTNSGKITTSGITSVGIMATSSSSSVGDTGNVSIMNSGNVTTNGANGAVGIWGNSYIGDVTLKSIGANITTTGTGINNVGMEALTYEGMASIEFGNGTVQVAGQSSALRAVSSTASEVIIDAGSQVHGGWGPETAAVVTGGDAQTIINNGTIDALSERAIIGDSGSYPASTLDITNNGQMTGSVTAETSVTTLTNNGTWNLRNVADTNGDGSVRTLAVSISDLGTSGSNTIVNNGTINLLNNPAATTVDHTDEYDTGYAANTMALNGPVQAKLLGVATFTNNGVIDMSANKAAGDVLYIDGKYISGGKLVLDTVLNEGGANSKSDMLVVGSTEMGNGQTLVTVKNAGGAGAPTVGNGIELVRVLDPNQSAADVFHLNNRVAAGLYEYDLYQGGVGSASGDGNWYLRTLTDGSGPVQRPEPYVYVRNMAASNSMFIHTLHDRLGEPQYTDTYGTDGKSKKDYVPAVWGRVMASTTDSESAGGRIDTETNTTLVHMGGDIAQWTSGNSRYHLGVMGAYGKSDSYADATDVRFTSTGLARKASGDVEGYGVGVYGTWYGNDKKPVGPYVDVWAMFNWFDNTVQGNGLQKETYNSNGQIVSIEAGYAFLAHDGETRQWMIEPQAQLAYTLYSASDHVEANGTRVSNDDGDGLISRLGVRFYSRSKLQDNGVQPFIEANWWHSTANNSLDFDGTTVTDGAPDSRYELKIGLQAEIVKHWQVWGHVGGQWGADSYDRYEAMAGVKYTF
ncbi:MAG: autotransporter outer membrane beta-barrel domain-containing protein [Desulfobulbus sp.]|nr:autotransporter outer membrane beta-barrel domain-containing protein [Desulfobulbus sp.]